MWKFSFPRGGAKGRRPFIGPNFQLALWLSWQSACLVNRRSWVRIPVGPFWTKRALFSEHVFWTNFQSIQRWHHEIEGNCEYRPFWRCFCYKTLMSPVRSDIGTFHFAYQFQPAFFILNRAPHPNLSSEYTFQKAPLGFEPRISCLLDRRFAN